jgi:hypothetical protein
MGRRDDVVRACQGRGSGLISAGPDQRHRDRVEEAVAVDHYNGMPTLGTSCSPVSRIYRRTARTRIGS